MKPFTIYPLDLHLKEVSIKINMIKGKHENLLANANVSFKFETGEYFTVTGFGIWNSKFGGLNVTMPQKAGFKFCLFEKGIWNKIKKFILDAYDYAGIDIVEES
jgi:hypothetical protein